MNHAFYVIPLLLVISIPTVFAETGQNYDTVTNGDGSVTWTSHPERIMDGGWQNYALTNNAEKVIFNTNSVGSFVFDKNSCSYSIYGNGFDGQQIIPSVSAVATYYSNGQWQNLPINDETCTVSVEPYEDGVYLTSTKVITEDIVEDVFIPYTGTTENFYVNATNANYNLIQSSNGTNTGYFNGETITTTGQVVEEFTQEIRLDINSGFKETFKVWHDGDESLGISQTVHTGESITIGETVIDIAQLNGQSFDRQFIIDNQAEILAITDSVNYDFDTGIESLTGINIIHDSEYKVNMDFSDGEFVGYLEIDPTLTTTGSGTFDVSAIWEHTIASGTIDGVTLTSTQITNLQNDLNAQNQYHTLSGTTLILSYTVNTAPDAPTGLSTTTGIPIETSWTAPTDNGGSAITGYKVFRTLNEFAQTELPNNSANANGVDFTGNEFLLHGFESVGGSETTITDDFSSNNGWTSSDTSKLDIASGALQIYSGTGVHYISKDLTGSGEIVGDFTIQYEATYTTLGSTSLGIQFHGVSDSQANAQTAQDELFLLIYDGANNFQSGTTDNGRPDQSSNQGALSPTPNPTTTTYYIELERNGADWITNVYSDSGFSNSIGTRTVTDSNPTGLRYFTVQTYSTGDYAGSIDNFSFTYTPVVTQTLEDKSTNSISITATGTSTDGVIDTGIQSPDLSFTDSNLPDNTDNFSVGSWVKLDGTPTNTKLLQLNDVTFNVGTTSASVENTATSTTIISATGLTSNLVNPQHYSFTRDGSSWILYQNGASIATVTDSTSLGSNIGNNYSTNISGMIDEYFINSDVLTSTEIDSIYDRGVAPTQLATSTTTSHDDSTVTGGNTYYYSVKATNAIGDSAYLTPFVSGLAGTPPNAPVISTAINDPNVSPLEITISISPDAVVGSGTLTGFEIYRDGVLITTTGLVNSYTDSVTAGSHSHYVKAVSSHGTSGNSNTANITTPSVPSSITDLSGSVISNTQINVTWTAPSDGGSNIDLYKIFRDGSQIDTTTNTSYSATGLTANTSYTFVVVANNSVGDSANSNSITETTYQSVSGSITVTPNTQGATTQLTFSASGVTGTPTPTFSTFTLKEGINVIASGISSPYTLTLNDNSPHTYTITSTDNTHWNTPTISGSTTVTATYSPTWNNNISYNYTRASGVMDLTVNRDSQSLWDATCNYKTTAQVMADQSGIVSNFTNVWYINDSQNIADTDTVYVSCSDEGTQLFAFTSFGPNRLGGGIAQLDDVFGDMTGTPVALIFVLLVAGLFTGRSAPTGILLVLALIGVLGFIGMLTIDEAVWGFLLLAGVLGIFLGKRFL